MECLIFPSVILIAILNYNLNNKTRVSLRTVLKSEIWLIGFDYQSRQRLINYSVQSYHNTDQWNALKVLTISWITTRKHYDKKKWQLKKNHKFNRLFIPDKNLYNIMEHAF